MTKKMKKTRNRIIAVLIAFAILLVAEHTGLLDKVPAAAVFVIYLIPYLVIVYDVLRKAFINIVRTLRLEAWNITPAAHSPWNPSA